MKARIFRPTRNAMQSGAKEKPWLLAIPASAPLYVEPLMGWTGMTDTTQELSLRFATEEAALAYAKKNGIEVEIIEPKERVIKPKSYSANFAFRKTN